MIVRTLQQVDLVYALFLGRLPENNFVREDNVGRPVTDLAKAAIDSKEFEQSVVERFLQYELLPHRSLSVELLPDVLQLIAEAQLSPPGVGLALGEWKVVLGRVLAAAPCRPMLEARYGATGRQLIDRLCPTASPGQRLAQRSDGRRSHPSEAVTQPEIVSGVDLVANTICRGWIVDRNAPDQLLHVQIRLNGRTAKIVAADELRRDVQALYGGAGRAGFTIRLDLLPDARHLSRATIEIRAVGHDLIVLPEHVVELNPLHEVGIETEFREELCRVRDCIERLWSAYQPDSGDWRAKPLYRAVHHLRARIADPNAVPIRQELSQLLQSLNRLEQELPSLRHGQSWALTFYGVVRALLPFVLPPPAAGTAASFSLVVIADGSAPGAAEKTLASALAQTHAPDEVFLVLSTEAPAEFGTQEDAVEIVRLPPNEPATAVINSSAARMKGSHLIILDAGATLAPEALAWLDAAIERTAATIIYTDGEDPVVGEDGSERVLPRFLPAFDADLLLQRNYIGDTICIERRAYVELEGLSCDPLLDARHDLLLRALDRFGPGSCIHLPLLLVHSPPSLPSRDLQSARDRTLRTVQLHLGRIGSRGRAVAHEDAIGRPVSDAVKILWADDATSRISVIVPTLDSADMVFALISSLRRRAANWGLIEVIVVVNGELDPRSRFGLAEIEKVFDCVQVVYRQVLFNWAEINNTAVRDRSSGELLVFLNDDMICLTDGWDARVRGQLARNEVGVVGGRLLYPNGAIQHAGIAFSQAGTTAHEAMGDAPEDGLYQDRTLLTHETGAVTGAFLACRRAVFDTLNGFNALRYVVTSSDADFCVRARAAGRIVIYDPFLSWIHYESVSRGRDSDDYKKQWRAEAEHERWHAAFPEIDRLDLSVNPHLARSVRPFSTFHRVDREAIEMWLQAQVKRRERWQRAGGDPAARLTS
jgi:GT2 family glycosyltransferase